MRYRLLSWALAISLTLACTPIAIPLFPSIPGKLLGRSLPAPTRVPLAPTSPPAAPKPGWTSYTNDANHVSDIVFDRDGTPWTGGPGGLVRWDLAQGTYTRYTVEDGLAHEYVYSIAVASDGALWCGTGGGGVTRFSPNRDTWTTYTTADGLAGNVVWSIAVGSGGTLWFGTDGGLSSFDGCAWTTHTQSATIDVVVGPDGAVWSCSGARSFPMGTEPGGVLRLSPDGEQWTRYTEEDGLACDVVFCIVAAPDGAMWFGTMNGVSRLAPDENAWTTYIEKDGLASDGAVSIAFDSDGTPWFSTLRVSCLIELDGLCHFDGETWTTYAIGDSVLHDGVSDIAAGPDGALWFGACGLSRYDGETLTTYTTRDDPTTRPR